MRSHRNPLVALVLGAMMLAGCGSSPATTASARAHSSALRVRAHAPGALKLAVLPQAQDGLILAALHGAQRSIRMEMYLLTHQGVMDELVAAKARGINVQVMLEPKPFNPVNPGSPLPTNQVAAQRLAQGGVIVSWSSPAFTYTHAKALTIDDRVTYVSTANFTKSGLGVAGKGSREYIVADSDPTDVAEYVALFNADLNRQTYMPSNPNLVISPDNARQKLLSLMESATQEIDLAVEVAGDPAIDQEVARKVKQGVKVVALLANLSTLRDSRGNPDVARTWKAAGAQVRLQSAPHLHAKTIVVDGTLAYVGSTNFTTNSMDHNRELGLLVDDSVIARTIAQTILQDFANAKDPLAALPKKPSKKKRTKDEPAPSPDPQPSPVPTSEPTSDPNTEPTSDPTPAEPLGFFSE